MGCFIDYGTGAERQYVEGTVEDAMRVADQGAVYTQCDINIYIESGPSYVPDDSFSWDSWESPYSGDTVWLVAGRKWFGEPYCPHEGGDAEKDILSFGELGYYGAWSYIYD